MTPLEPCPPHLLNLPHSLLPRPSRPPHPPHSPPPRLRPPPHLPIHLLRPPPHHHPRIQNPQVDSPQHNQRDHQPWLEAPLHLLCREPRRHGHRHGERDEKSKQVGGYPARFLDAVFEAVEEGGRGAEDEEGDGGEEEKEKEGEG